MPVNPPPTSSPDPRPRSGTLRGPSRRLRHLLLIAIIAAPIHRASIPTQGQSPFTWLRGDYVDYAPSGVPDFSQCRGEWSRPGAPPQWTHAGPVALADLLWWLDSRAETDPMPPDTHSDHHPLITAYPVFGRQPDDHAASNLGPLVEDLALRMKTNGVGPPEASSEARGTRWEQSITGLGDYLESRRVADIYRLVTRNSPDSEWLEARVAEDAGVLLYLAVWERREVGWAWVGGHYAALAGAGPDRVALADPLADRASENGRGRAVPEDPAHHGCRSAPAAHDDAANLSHDLYETRSEPGLPLPQIVLEGYFDEATWGEAAAFRAQNGADFLDAHAEDWTGREVRMSVAAALALTPLEPPGTGPVPTASPSASAGASATPRLPSATPSLGTASATPRSIRTATAIRSPTHTLLPPAWRLILPILHAKP